MEVLPLSVIERYILPSLSVGTRGKTESVPMLSIVRAILHRLKTGSQWREISMKEFFDSKKYTWQGVYYHYRRWVQDGSWRTAFLCLLREHRRVINMSSVQLDASHTPAKRGGEAVGYQHRKRCRTTNMLVIADTNGTPLACATPQSGEHHDVFQIETALRELAAMLQQAGINLDGVFLNADAAFDTARVRALCAELGIEVNIPVNPRKAKTQERDEYFDEKLYKKRMAVERAFARLDGFKALLVRYEKKLSHWTAWNIIGFIVIFLRKMLDKKKS